MDKHGIRKYREVFDAWLKGKTIQYKHVNGDKWKDVRNDDPSFALEYEWRVNPKAHSSDYMMEDEFCRKILMGLKITSVNYDVIRYDTEDGEWRFTIIEDGVLIVSDELLSDVWKITGAEGYHLREWAGNTISKFLRVEITSIRVWPAYHTETKKK